MAAAKEEAANEWLEFAIESDPFVANEESGATDEAKAQTENRRQLAIAKLISDCKDYLVTLELIGSVFVAGLKPLLTGAQMANIFSNFDKIVESTRKFLEALEARKAQRADGVHLVGDLCKAHSAAVMGPYTVFTANKQTALSTLAAVSQSQSPAAKLLAGEATKGPDRDLTKLLNLPILHLGRLDSLFHRILKATPAGHDDHDRIKEAASRMKQTRESIQMEVKKLETLAALAAWEQRLVYGEKVEPFKLMEPGRLFVREGPLTLLIKKLSLTGKQKEPHDVKALVFTDLVILAEPVPGSNKLTVLTRPIVLGEGTVHSVPNTDNEFLLTYKQEHHLLRCKDKEERELWMKLLLEPKMRGEGTLMQTRRDRTFSVGAQAPCMRGIASKEIIIPRTAAGGSDWGFALDPASPTHLQSLDPSGAAAKNGLRELDEILAINGVHVTNMAHEVISEILKAASGPNLRLTVVASRRHVVVVRSAAGLGFAIHGHHPAYVSSVQIGGAGEAGGIKVGDQLLRVNGHDVSGLSHEEVEQALAKGDGVELVVRTAMRTLVVPGSGELGFTLVQPVPGQPSVVSAVSRDSAAWTAGLRPGDQLWDVSGKPVRGELLDALMPLLTDGGDHKLLVVNTLRDVLLPPAAAEGDLSEGLSASLSLSSGLKLSANPARILSLGANAAAADLGLAAGDVVWEINGTPVLQAKADIVDALLAKHAANLRLRVSLVA